MCNISRPFESIFARSNSFELEVDNFPSTSFVSIFALNISPSILIFITSSLYMISLLNHNLKFIYKREQRRIIIVLHTIVQTFIMLWTVLLVWDIFDSISQTLCTYTSETCQNISCVFENNTQTVIASNILNFVSWRPLIFVVSIIVPLIPIIFMFFKVNALILSSIFFLLISILLNITSFYVQQLCSFYSKNKCECPFFSEGMISICSIPFFDVSLLIGISCFMNILTYQRQKRVISQIRVQIQPNNKKNEFIELPNNRQFNNTKLNTTEYVETTRDKWFNLIGL